MQWHSVNEFLAMGGYAFYVWGSVGACAVTMLAEPWLVRRKHRRLLRSLQPRRAADVTVRYAATLEATR